MSSYYSFLVCRHADKTDLYVNGIPLGLIRDGKFERAQIAGRPLQFSQLPDPLPFKTVAELKAELHRFVDAIEIAEPPAVPQSTTKPLAVSA